MKYICSVCGYVHDEAVGDPWDALGADWKCPLCGAGKDAFAPERAPAAAAAADKPHVEQELGAMELSIVCSNLARGCEKQYLPQQAEDFAALAEFFRQKATPAPAPDRARLLELLEQDLTRLYPYGNAVAGEAHDRGALRCQVWSEKVTNMLRSLLRRYEAEGEKMLENTGVWVCSICGFVWVGESAPALCPVCKVPDWKFEKAEGRAQT